MIKVLELFGGIGACSKALENLNIKYELSDYVEIDKYAVASFNALHNTNYIPQDITKWDKDNRCRFNNAWQSLSRFFTCWKASRWR